MEAGGLPQARCWLRGSPWQRLYLRPDPHGHSSFLPTLPLAAAPAAPADSVRCSDWPVPSSLGALYRRRLGRCGAVSPRGARPAGIAGASGAP
jgi:hypothetical protein